MYLLDHTIRCSSRADRVEIYPLYDIHFGKRNCNERALKKQLAEILRREKLPNRYVRVLLGGDQLNSISPRDLKRFDFHELADWFVDGDAETTRDRLSDIANQEVLHAVEVLEPVKHLVIGALVGNHEKAMMTQQNVNVQDALCTQLGITNLSDEALIRFRFQRTKQVASVQLYARHGYGGGRGSGAEPNKLAAMIAEWETADVCLSGHSHSFCVAAPKPVLWLSNKGRLPERLHVRHRYGANPGCWLQSHPIGASTYESMACYPARPMMTCKIVVWPFWRGVDGTEHPKIEVRSYAIE